jgi:hypothetical protein
MSGSGHPLAGIVSEKAAQYTISVARRQRYFSPPADCPQVGWKRVVELDLWYYFPAFRAPAEGEKTINYRPESSRRQL